MGTEDLVKDEAREKSAAEAAALTDASGPSIAHPPHPPHPPHPVVPAPVKPVAKKTLAPGEHPIYGKPVPKGVGGAFVMVDGKRYRDPKEHQARPENEGE